MDGQSVTRANAATSTDDELRPSLVRIEEQGRQTLELVRALIGMLMPKDGAREGPTLEELLATLIMQQREMIGLERGIQSAVLELPRVLTPLVAEAVVEALGPGAAYRQ